MLPAQGEITMDKLFTLYRCLAQKQSSDQEDIPYTIALQALEILLDMVTTTEHWGDDLQEPGGLQLEQADMITEEIVAGYKTALCTLNGSATLAIMDFVKSYISLDKTDELIKLIVQHKEEAEHVHKENRDFLGYIDGYGLNK